VRTIAMLSLLLPVAFTLGCKKSPVGQEADQQAAQQEKIAQTQQEQSQKLDEIRSRIAGLSSAAASQKAQPDFNEDLIAAKRLVSQLSIQASKQQDQDAAATDARLMRCLAALVAGAPASRIQQHLERAEVHLNAGDLAEASAQVLAAAGAAYNPTAPALVPDVLTQLEDASVALSNGDAAKATTIVSQVLGKTAQDATTSDLLVAQMTAIAAADSLRLKAWPILVAQTTHISNLLAGVEKRAQPQPAQEKPATTGSATGQPPTPAPSGASAQAPAETPKTAGQPAAGTAAKAETKSAASASPPATAPAAAPAEPKSP